MVMIYEYYCTPFPSNASIVFLLHLSYKINNLALLLYYTFIFKSLLLTAGITKVEIGLYDWDLMRKGIVLKIYE